MQDANTAVLTFVAVSVALYCSLFLALAFPFLKVVTGAFYFSAQVLSWYLFGTRQLFGENNRSLWFFRYINMGLDKDAYKDFESLNESHANLWKNLVELTLFTPRQLVKKAARESNER
jgi:hypothetical protein